MAIINKRRHVFKWLAGLGGAVAASQSEAHHTESHFDNKSLHRIVYQCNRAEDEYLGSVLFSVGELLRKYGDDVEMVVACFGPGLHLIAQQPGRSVSEVHQERASSLATYGVSFHACRNTMASLHWTEEDIMPYAKVVPIGVDDIMLLQEEGFAYFAW